MKMKLYLKGLSAIEKRKMAMGFIRVAFERQRGYMAWATPILLVGLYGDKSKEFVVSLVTNLWFWIVMIPIWVVFIFFDMFVMLPGEQLFYAKSNRIIMDLHDDIAKNNKI